MTPLQEPPLRGYSDFQRTDNWDSGTLYSHGYLLQNVQEQTPVLDVSRYAYLGGIDGPVEQPVSVSLGWYGEAGAITQFGGRQLTLHPSVPGDAQYHILNLGPYLQVTWQQPAGLQFHHGVELFATNRPGQLDLVPADQNLIWTQLTNILAGAVLTLYPRDYYAGPGMVWANMPATLTATWQWYDPSNTWFNFARLAGTGADQLQSIVTPPGAWRVQIANGDTVAHAPTLVHTASLTGGT